SPGSPPGWNEGIRERSPGPPVGGEPGGLGPSQHQVEVLYGLAGRALPEVVERGGGEERATAVDRGHRDIATMAAPREPAVGPGALGAQPHEGLAGEAALPELARLARGERLGERRPGREHDAPRH